MLTKEDSQTLKGLAIILMLFHHLFLNKERFINFSGAYFPINENLLINISIACKICVSIFAFISGYGLYYSLESYSGGFFCWIKQHLIKTLSSFWFIALFFYGAVFLLNYFFNFYNCTLPSNNIFMNIIYIFLDIIGISNLINTFTLCGTWWYIGTAIFFILISPLLYNLIKKYTFTILILIALIPYIFKLGYPGGENTLTYLPIFGCGMYFANNKLFNKVTEYKISNNSIISTIIKFTILLGGGFVCIVITMKTEMKKDNLWPVFYCVFPMIVILLCKLYIFKIVTIAKSLQFLGLHATNIWLCHTFIRENLLRFYSYFPHFIICFLLLLLLSIILSFIFIGIRKILRYDNFINYL